MTTPEKTRGASWCFCSTIFVSAFLIFQVQPLISKYILPWFGGTPGVWSACMLFFQTLLFAGYAYAHFSIRRFRPAVQALTHLTLLAVAMLCLPITPNSGWKPTGHDEPTWQILGMLLASVGLPYFVLSSTGPLLQAWFNRAQPEASPYRLYALSNIGSVLGLISYPFLVEPLWTTETQARFWSAGFILFALTCGWCAVRAWKCNPSPCGLDSQNNDCSIEPQGLAPQRQDKLLWFGLSACASTMLLATTNQVCLDVAVIPFLWVLPLSLYLLSFILVFDHERWYPQRTFTIAMTVSVTCVMLVTFQSVQISILRQLIVHFGTLFFCCMVCHGELVKLKPEPRFLTSFYLATAAGGAAGGLFVGLLAPVLFERLIELQIGLIGCCLFILGAHFRDRCGMLSRRPMWTWTCLLVSVLGLVRLLNSTEASQSEVAISRNFFGVLRVLEEHRDDPQQHTRTMVHGRTQHGRQFMAAEKRHLPTTYYGETTGVGLAMRHLPRTGGGIRGGLVGLGVGTLAAYGQSGDVFRFYEIDPDVLRLAREHFTFLSDSPATVDVVLGDARLALEREESQQYDILVLDAFSSDAIPVHLLTREAMAIYSRHLRPNGVLAIHISNRFFDLQPIVARLGHEFGFRAEKIASRADDARSQFVSDWMLLSRCDDFWNIPDVQRALAPSPVSQKTQAPAPLWTDQFSNLIGILR